MDATHSGRPRPIRGRRARAVDDRATGHGGARTIACPPAMASTPSERSSARETTTDGGESETDGDARAWSADEEEESRWNTTELHRRLRDLNVNNSRSSSEESSGRSATSGPDGSTDGGSASSGATSTPTGVLPHGSGGAKMTSKMTTKEVTLGAQRFDSLNQYILIKDLGSGSHSKVKLAMNQQDNALYAVKWTHARVNSLKAVRKEIAVLKKLNHPNIRTLHEVIDDEFAKELILVLEYCETGPVFTRFSTTPVAEEVLRRYARDVVLGLDYLHSLRIAHMDLKPENMLLCADGSVKLADFGVSFIHDVVLSDGVEKRLVGTPAFLAPEVPSEAGYDPFRADIWSLGVCFYNMAMGRLPFRGKTVFQICAHARSSTLEFNEDLSDNFKDLVRCMLCVDAEKRVDIAGVMHHNWITHGGTDPLARPLTELPHNIVEVTEEEIASAVRTDPLAALLQPAFNLVEFNDRDILMRKGAIGEVMYFINKGYVDVLLDAVGVDLDTIDVEHESDVLVVRQPGEIVGEIAFLTALQGIRDESYVHGYRTATVRAKGPVECLAVSLQDMIVALGKDESSRERIVRSASFKLDQNEEVRLQLLEKTSRTSTDSEREEKQAPFAPKRTIHVLYAEDSMPTQMIVKAFLRKLGNVEVVIAPDGKRALDAHRSINNKFDMILMDCQMPVMDGLEATRQIRSLNSEKATVPIVGVSSGVEGMGHKECIANGMNGFVSKPLNKQKIVDVIQKTLPDLFKND